MAKCLAYPVSGQIRHTFAEGSTEQWSEDSQGAGCDKQNTGVIVIPAVVSVKSEIAKLISQCVRYVFREVKYILHFLKGDCPSGAHMESFKFLQGLLQEVFQHLALYYVQLGLTA